MVAPRPGSGPGHVRLGFAVHAPVAGVDPHVQLTPADPAPEVMRPLELMSEERDLVKEPEAVYGLGVLVVDRRRPLVFVLVEARLVGGAGSSSCSPMPWLRNEYTAGTTPLVPNGSAVMSG